MDKTNITDSWVQRIQMPSPSLGDNMADADRLITSLKQSFDIQTIQMDYELLKTLPKVLRTADFDVICTVWGFDNNYHLIDIQPIKDCLPVYGLAIDIGTTRVVMRLINLQDHNRISEISIDNPQSQIAPDVLARVHYTDRENGLENLQKLIIDDINQNIEEICQAHKISSNRILCMSIAGNTCMSHLFLGLSPQAIIREPYIPVINKQLLLKGSDLDIQINPQGRIFVFPNIGSYFGGDVISGILALNMHQREDIAMLVDVGTNAEVVIGNKDWMLACAGAAGPALEGGVSKIGMTAGPGAIERIQWHQGEFSFQTIVNEKPVGICGSGIIDLAAALFQAGMLDIRGKFVPDICKDRLRLINGIHHFQVVSSQESATQKDLTISQADIDSLIRSKAAMYTILTTITESVGMSLSDISTFYIAGTFGAYIDPVSAITIGMMPDVPLTRYQSVGNTSLSGATQVLISRKAMESVSEIHRLLTYMELNVNQAFMNRFSAAKFLPHTDRGLFPSVQ